MKIYTCNKFTGHYPAAPAAVVRASSPEDAASILNEDLRELGLDGDAEPQHMIEFLETSYPVRILCDGNY